MRVVGLLAAVFAGIGCEVPAKSGGNIAAALQSEHVAVEPGRPFYLGLRMRMRRGWHTYWKNPGDSGLPLRITWNLPEGFSAGPIEWPAPERIREKTLMSYGYRREVLIPVEITPPERLTVDSVALAGSFEWLECKDICLPGSAELRLSLPVRRGTPEPSSAAPSFATMRSRMPQSPAAWSFSAEAGPRAISLAFRAQPGLSPRAAYLFVDRPLVADYSVPQGLERIAGGYRLTVSPAPNASGTLERLTGVLVVEGREAPNSRTAVQVDVHVSPGDPAPAPAQSERARWATPHLVLIALAGLGLAGFVAGAAFLRLKNVRVRNEPDE